MLSLIPLAPPTLSPSLLQDSLSLIFGSGSVSVSISSWMMVIGVGTDLCAFHNIIRHHYIDFPPVMLGSTLALWIVQSLDPGTAASVKGGLPLLAWV